MCEVLGVSDSGFHGVGAPGAVRQGSERRVADLEDQRDPRARPRRLWLSPCAGRAAARSGHRGLAQAVPRLMRQAGISGLVKVKRGRTTIRVPGVRVADDLVERQFRPDGTERAVGRRHHLPADLGGLALPRRRPGRLLAEGSLGGRWPSTCAPSSSLDALQMAVHRRRPEPGLVHHSDQGSQYVALGFGQQARDAGIAVSMGSKGDAYDNAVAESFFATTQEGARSPPTLADSQTRARPRPSSSTSRRSTTTTTTLHPRLPLTRGIRESDNHNQDQQLATQAPDCPSNGVHSRAGFEPATFGL